MSHQKDPEAYKTAQNAVKTYGASAAEAGAEKLAHREKTIADTATESHVDNGNTAAQNSGFDFSAIQSNKSVLGGASNTGGLSYAETATPSDNPLKKSAPTMHKEFETASTQTDSVKPDGQIDLAQKRDIDPASGLG